MADWADNHSDESCTVLTKLLPFMVQKELWQRRKDGIKELIIMYIRSLMVSLNEQLYDVGTAASMMSRSFVVIIVTILTTNRSVFHFSLVDSLFYL